MKKNKIKKPWKDISKFIYYENMRKEFRKYVRKERNKSSTLRALHESPKYAGMLAYIDFLFNLCDKFRKDDKEKHKRYSDMLDWIFESDLYKEFEEKCKPFRGGLDYGPFIKIYSKKDLFNRRFKLPIYEKPFNRLHMRFKAEYIGKTFIPDPQFHDPSGIIIGYGYAWDDDYAITLVDGKEKLNLLNSHWKIK